MDDYNLANVFLNHEEIQKHIVDLDSFQKIPFTELSGLGGAYSSVQNSHNIDKHSYGGAISRD